MDADDPLHGASVVRLLCRTLGPASSSKDDEAVLDAISRPLKGSKELVEQARLVLKEHGDTRMLYQDGGAKALAAANGKNIQPGRRPMQERKRTRYNFKPPPASVPVVDFSMLNKISDPVEYFKTLDRLEEAEAEIKRLTGQVATEETCNEPVDKTKRRIDLSKRRSVHKYNFSGGDYAQDPIEVPASRTGTVTESQLQQDDVHALVSQNNEQSVPSRSREHAILDVSVKEDLFTEKYNVDALTHAIRNLPESKGEDFLRDTLGLPQIRMENVCLSDSIVPGDRPPSNTARKEPMRVRTREPGGYDAQILELEKHFSFIAAAKDKCADLSKDDESEGSPDIVMGEQSLVLESSDVVLMTDESIATREIEGETPSLSARPAEYDPNPEPNMPDRVTIDEMQAEGSPLGLYRDTEVAKENDPCSRNSISKFVLQEEDLPMDYTTIDDPNNETEMPSSHHLAGSSTEVLVSTPCRNVVSDDIARTSHEAEDNNENQEVVEEDGVVQDKSSRPSEIPLDDIDPQNQSQVDDGSIKKLVADLQNALCPTKEKKQKAARKGKKKQRSKRGKEVSDEATHPLEIPQTNSDSENQPPMHDVNIEQQTVGTSNALSPNNAKGQKEARRSNKTKQLNRRKSLADAGLVWQSGVRKSTRIRSRPLEHWRGERFVYGRIHDTMATVIGIKAYSPDQDGKKALKVKSFVPEQYSDLVAESAKY